MRTLFTGTAICGVIMLSGCSGGGSSPNVTVTAAPIVQVFSFPQAYSKGTQSGTAFTVANVKTTLSSRGGNANGDAYDYLTIQTTFAQDISKAFPPANAKSTTLDGTQLSDLLSFNTNNSAGGFDDCGSIPPRDNYQSNPNPDANDNFPIDGGSNAVIFNQVNGDTLTQSLPLGGINVHSGSSVPHIGLTLEIGNGSQADFNYSDCVPGDGSQIIIGK